MEMENFGHKSQLLYELCFEARRFCVILRNTFPLSAPASHTSKVCRRHTEMERLYKLFSSGIRPENVLDLEFQNNIGPVFEGKFIGRKIMLLLPRRNIMSRFRRLEVLYFQAHSEFV